LDLSIRTADELETEVVRFAKELGFDTVSASVVIDRLCRPSEFLTVHNTPPAWYGFFGMPRGLRDLVMQHCKHSGIPIVWDQSTYVSAGRGEMREEQARFGYRCGIAVAMHLPYGRHFFLGVDRDRPLPRNREKMTRPVEAFALFAFRAEAAASEALLANSRDEIDLAPLDSSRIGSAALDRRGEDRLGSRDGLGNQRANGGDSCQQRDTQARLRQ